MAYWDWMPYGRTVQTFAFAVVAALTMISMGTQHDIFSDVILTKFVKLKITSDKSSYIQPNMADFKASNDKTRVTAFGLHTTQGVIDELRYKWRCPSNQQTIDIWGPDSMCRCLGHYVTPSSASLDPDAAMSKIEETCSKDVVPVYSKVFACSIRGYWNFYIGIIMLHISILFSMKSVEYARGELPEAPNVEADLVFAKTPSTDEKWAQTRRSTEEVVRDVAARKILSAHRRYKSRKNTPNTKDTRFSLATAFDWTRDVDTDDNIYMQVGTHKSQNQWDSTFHRLWDVLVVLLSILVFIFIVLVFDDKNDFVKFKVGGASTVLYIWSLVIAIVTALSIGMIYLDPYVFPFIQSLMSSFKMGRSNQETTDTQPQQSGNESGHESMVEGVKLVEYIYLCVMQDLNYITGFMLIISTFSAQSGEHDDHTIFLDIACVLFIGFMQHLSHLTMLLKEEAIGLCEDQIYKQHEWGQQPGGVPNSRTEQLRGDNVDQDRTDDIRTPKYEAKMMDYIFQFFSATRLFIFIIIGISVYIFSVRIGPTAFGQDSVQSWNNNAKIFTLFFFISPSILYDLYYEIVHFDHMRRYQRHLQYFGPQIWRIWGGIGFIFVFFVMTLQGYGGDDNYYYDQNNQHIFLGGIMPRSH